MTQLNDLFARNRTWAAEMERKQPGFFTGLTTQQKLYVDRLLGQSRAR